MSRPGGALFDLKPLLERFADSEDVVARLVTEDETFHSLCEDHALASEALRGLLASGRDEDADRIEDYRAIIAELELEIGSSIEQAKCAAGAEVHLHERESVKGGSRC